MDLTAVRQINLFIIKILFERWGLEIDKLKSSYFNYDHPQVQSALNEFMNTLSHHIYVDKKAFVPLLEQAVFDALVIIFSPYDYYMREISSPEKKMIRLKDLKENAKYYRVNAHLYNALINKFESENKQEVTPNEAGKLLDEVFKNFQGTPEDVEKYVDLFSQVLHLDPDSFYGENDESSPKPSKDLQNVNEQFKEPSTILNELHSEKAASLADEFTKQSSIFKQLSLNQRFMFLNELFHGDLESFNRTLEFLDNCKDKSEAIEYIENNIASENNWNTDSDEVSEFLELIHRKYSEDLS